MEITKEQKRQFNDIFESLGECLDISETQFNNAVSSYQAVGNWLSKADSELALYKPKISAQGSFLLGTMVKPINKEDDLDIDLVCELTGKNESWTQADVKSIVGDRIKANSDYKDMLDKEGRRCWTLKYRVKTKSFADKYHMDILPSITSEGYSTILEKAFSFNQEFNLDDLAIRITDKETENYYTSSNPEYWLKSNPFGYGKWFFDQASVSLTKSYSLREAIKPVPKYQTNKLPLQRVVQILKRHRDIMFNGDKDKPISIIITTLAAKAYNKETDVLSALLNVSTKMENFIIEKFDIKLQKNIKWIENPTNIEENFADKWIEHPKREDNFLKWLNALRYDLTEIFSIRGGINIISETMRKPFGNELVKSTFANYGEKQKLAREKGLLRMASITGTIGNTGTKISNHTFYGKNED